MAGKSHVTISFNLKTPSLLECYVTRVRWVASSEIESFANRKMHLNAEFMWQTPVLGERCLQLHAPVHQKVASLPSSTNWSHPSAPGTVSVRSVHHKYSGRVSLFLAKTVEVPAFAMPAAHCNTSKQIEWPEGATSIASRRGNSCAERARRKGVL